MKKRTIFLISLLFALFVNSCKYDFILPELVPPIDNGGNPISFASQIAPIFSNGNKCTACHNGGQAPDLRAASAFSQLVPAYVNKTNPASSQVYINARPGSSHYVQATATQAALILAWITEGANNN